MATSSKSLQNLMPNMPAVAAKTSTFNATLKDYAVEDAFVVNYLDNLLNQAIQQNASDIHFEAYENLYRVRFRCDGLLHEIATLPPQLVKPLITRIKILSNLDIAEQRLPQDGNCSKTLNEKNIDFRVSSCPTVFGEKIVMRLLNAGATMLDIDQLGFSTIQKELFVKTLRKPQGLVLVTGPTGSGKTTTLYAALRLLNNPQVNISTVEDPVEIHLPGVNQINVHSKIGLNFARVLRTLLRQDPDIILIGEIRDEETADIAIKAAQTGHLVLATLHTNSAAETIVRLLNMGAAPYNLAGALKLIIAQRLVRQLCLHCKQPVRLPDIYKSEFLANNIEAKTIHEAQGCTYCLNGYSGRSAVYEMLPFDTTLNQLLLAGKGVNITELEHYMCNTGWSTLRTAGLVKVGEGATSLTELERVI